ncbi:MAG: family 16 glycoside hydrolase, partial [Anaerolineaceae bacterium]
AAGGNTSADVLLQDDFSNPKSGWEVADYDAGSVGYVDGTYFVTSTAANQAMWGLAFKDFSDVAIEVAASQISAPESNNNDYGVMCRMTETSGYSFNISGDGYYSVQRMDDNAFVNLVEWTQSNKINTGNATNTIKVVCQGSTLTLYVNGSKLAETTDATYTTGDIALATTTYEDAVSEIHFDNILVTQP